MMMSSVLLGFTSFVVNRSMFGRNGLDALDEGPIGCYRRVCSAHGDVMKRPVRDHDDADSYYEVLTPVPRRPRIFPGQVSYRSAARYTILCVQSKSVISRLT